MCIRDRPGIVWVCLLYVSIAASAMTFVLLQFAVLRLPSAKVMAYTYLVPVSYTHLDVYKRQFQGAKQNSTCGRNALTGGDPGMCQGTGSFGPPGNGSGDTRLPLRSQVLGVPRPGRLRNAAT